MLLPLGPSLLSISFAVSICTCRFIGPPLSPLQTHLCTFGVPPLIRSRLVCLPYQGQWTGKIYYYTRSLATYLRRRLCRNRPPQPLLSGIGREGGVAFACYRSSKNRFIWPGPTKTGPLSKGGLSLHTASVFVRQLKASSFRRRQNPRVQTLLSH